MPDFFSYASLCEANQLKGTKPLFSFFQKQFQKNATKET